MKGGEGRYPCVVVEVRSVEVHETGKGSTIWLSRKIRVQFIVENKT